jgi:hypothetical protein
VPTVGIPAGPTVKEEEEEKEVKFCEYWYGRVLRNAIEPFYE